MNNSSELLDSNNFLVFGAARSGLAAARLLKRLGKNVALYDEASPEKLVDAINEARSAEIPFFHSLEDIDFSDHCDVMILSPGIPTDHPLVDEAELRGCLVRSELELGYLVCPAPVIGITGTNGKTTTTNLMTHLLKQAGKPVRMAGNVGMPLCDVALDPELRKPGAWVVCEVSSFQLELIEHFRPRIACVLNISADHMDRHLTMDNYLSVKRRITENQTDDDVLVLNADDRVLMSMTAQTQASLRLFSLGERVNRGAFLEHDALWLSMGGSAEPVRVMSREDVPLPGAHNVANILASLAMGDAAGLTPSEMADAVRTFEPVPHRIEPVGQLDGVAFYNDSKATNLDSLKIALRSFDAPIVLIAGGRDKRSPWSSLKELVGDRVKTLILIGEAAPLIQDAWGEAVEDVREASDMEEAVEIARSSAAPGDVVLLSPACASFDMYKNYEERGDRFREIVRKMEKREA